MKTNHKLLEINTPENGDIYSAENFLKKHKKEILKFFNNTPEAMCCTVYEDTIGALIVGIRNENGLISIYECMSDCIMSVYGHVIANQK